MGFGRELKDSRAKALPIRKTLPRQREESKSPASILRMTKGINRNKMTVPKDELANTFEIYKCIDEQMGFYYFTASLT